MKVVSKFHEYKEFFRVNNKKAGQYRSQRFRAARQ